MHGLVAYLCKLNSVCFLGKQSLVITLDLFAIITTRFLVREYVIAVR
jgi:hypothetical protein